MKIYPNPARSKAFISLPDEFKKGGNLVVTNKMGEIIQTQEIAKDSSSVISLDLTNQPNGLYKVSLSDQSTEMSGELLNLSEMIAQN